MRRTYARGPARAGSAQGTGRVRAVFVLYVIITDPAKAADYVQIGFQGISDAAKAVGDFFTWLADGAH